MGIFYCEHKDDEDNNDCNEGLLDEGISSMQNKKFREIYKMPHVATRELFDVNTRTQTESLSLSLFSFSWVQKNVYSPTNWNILTNFVIKISETSLTNDFV